MDNFTTKYKLTTNPFRLTPAINPTELVWAGFQTIKETFEKRIERSIRIPNSTLVLNWGEYGSGKTHAARYFSKEDVLSNISTRTGKSTPYPMVISLPKGKDPIYSIYTSVIDKLDIEEIRTLFTPLEQEISSFISSIGSNIHIQNVLKAIFDLKTPHLEIKKYLYGNTSASELKGLNRHGILRPLKDETDFTAILAGLFSCLTYGKNIYSCVIIWIDEFEDIATFNNTNVDKINNFVRDILDNTPNNLLIFINLTQSALLLVEDLGQYLYENVRSRIKERINFELPNATSFKNYLSELLQSFRPDTSITNEYFPFDEEVIDTIIKKQGSVSLRQFNDSLSLLLELSDMDNKCPIDIAVFEEYESEIIWDKH